MPLTYQQTHNSRPDSRPGNSKHFYVKRKTVIRISLLLGWIMIALILMTATGTVYYGNIKYFFWLVPVSTVLLYLLYMNSKSSRLSKEEEIKSVLALVFTFVCLIVAFLASILLGH